MFKQLSDAGLQQMIVSARLIKSMNRPTNSPKPNDSCRVEGTEPAVLQWPQACFSNLQVTSEHF